MTKSSFVKFWANFEKVVDFKATSHMLRHTYWHWLYDNGIDLKTAQYFMGDSDIRIAAIYIRRLATIRYNIVVKNKSNF